MDRTFEALLEEVERIPGAHTFKVKNGKLIISCERNAECQQLSDAVNGRTTSREGTLLDSDGVELPVEIIWEDRPSAVLPVFDYVEKEATQANPFVVTTHRQCHNIPKGGCQIAPLGANWVGTLGGACSFTLPDNPNKRYFGCVTNWHVANGGRFGSGDPIGQPSGNSPKFGVQRTWETISFSQQASNVMDVSFIDCENGVFHVISPEMIGLGNLETSYNDNPRQGQLVKKTGRTTGIQRNGRITGVGITTFVNYGSSGVARFVNQLEIRQNGRNFSDSGDSGSLIVDERNRPIALLFAGSGQTTIASPLKPIVDKFNVSFDLGQ